MSVDSRGGGRSADKSEQKWGKGGGRALVSGGELRSPKVARDRSVRERGRRGEQRKLGVERGAEGGEERFLGVGKGGPRAAWAAPGRLGWGRVSGQARGARPQLP